MNKIKLSTQRKGYEYLNEGIMGMKFRDNVNYRSMCETLDRICYLHDMCFTVCLRSDAHVIACLENFYSQRWLSPSSCLHIFRVMLLIWNEMLLEASSQRPVSIKSRHTYLTKLVDLVAVEHVSCPSHRHTTYQRQPSPILVVLISSIHRTGESRHGPHCS